MPRSRAARGTESRRKEASFEVEHTALETSPFAQPTHTSVETSPFAHPIATFVYEDATFEDRARAFVAASLATSSDATASRA